MTYNSGVFPVKNILDVVGMVSISLPLPIGGFSCRVDTVQAKVIRHRNDGVALTKVGDVDHDIYRKHPAHLLLDGELAPLVAS